MTDHVTRIVTARAPGGPEVLKIEERRLDPAGEGEVLVNVVAAGVNRPDRFERMGFYPAPPGAPEGLGLEVSGTVRDAGPGVSFRPGDKVVALVTGGGYSDIARAKAVTTLRAPEGVDLVHAAGLPETVMTVFANAFVASELKPGEHFLVHGGASGIGTTAVQMARAHGCTVMATAGSAEKCQLVRDLGADHVFNYREDDWAAGVREAGGADVILDMVGGDYVEQNLSVLNMDGRISMIAFLKGSRVEVDLMRLMLKRLTITGSTLRARPDVEKAVIAEGVKQAVWPWIEAGKVRPIVDSTFKLEDVAKAHERIDAMAHAGKILLTP